MNKKAELEQAYWGGFRTKCAEYGVDAVKSGQEIRLNPAGGIDVTKINPDWVRSLVTDGVGTDVVDRLPRKAIRTSSGGPGRVIESLVKSRGKNPAARAWRGAAPRPSGISIGPGKHRIVVNHSRALSGGREFVTRTAGRNTLEAVKALQRSVRGLPQRYAPTSDEWTHLYHKARPHGKNVKTITSDMLRNLGGAAGGGGSTLAAFKALGASGLAAAKSVAAAPAVAIPAAAGVGVGAGYGIRQGINKLTPSGKGYDRVVGNLGAKLYDTLSPTARSLRKQP